MQEETPAKQTQNEMETERERKREEEREGEPIHKVYEQILNEYIFKCLSIFVCAYTLAQVYMST